MRMLPKPRQSPLFLLIIFLSMMINVARSFLLAKSSAVFQKRVYRSMVSSSSHHQQVHDEKILRRVEDEVLRFWFQETPQSLWFAKNDDFDRSIATKFGNYNQLARDRCLDLMKNSPLGSLALIIVMDQFNRNMFRNTPEAFASDPYCVELTEYAISKKFDKEIFLQEDDASQKLAFLFMPLMHCEELSKQDLLLTKCEEFGLDKKFAIDHRDDIIRFGRFPSRNEALGRVSTPEEEAYLNSLTGSRF